MSRDFLSALGLTALLFALIHGYALGEPYTVNDDARQQLYWMQAWQDPQLYQGHWLTDYARRYVTWGVKALYKAGSFLISPLTFSKYVAGGEFILLGALLFAIGRSLAGRAAGWGVLCVYWLMPVFMHNISGGLARSFAAPLMALFWFGWQKGVCAEQGPGAASRWAMLAAIVLLGLFIPYIYVLCAFSLALAWTAGMLRLAARPPVPRRWWEYAVLAASAVPVWLFNQGLAGSGFGPMATAADMAGDPVFGMLGRFPILPVPSLPFELVARPLERIIPFREFGTAAGIAACLLLAVVCWLGLRRTSGSELLAKARPFLWILLSSLTLWVVARFLLLKLFIPSRYLEYTMAFGWCVLLGVLAAAFLAPLLRRRWIGALVVGACLATGAARLHGEALYDYSGAAGLYEAVRQTSKDSLFAGHPYSMDNVLTFGRRKVLASYELAHPWSRGLWHRLQPQFAAMLEAYYAKDEETVREFCKRFEIDYIVVDERHFSRGFIRAQKQLVPVCQAPMPDVAHTLCKVAGLDFPVVVWNGKRMKGVPGDHPMFAPYASRIESLAQKPGAFALLDLPQFRGRTIDEHVRLVDVRTLR